MDAEIPSKALDDLKAQVEGVPDPFKTDWEQGDGYMVWVAAFHAPSGGVFMHRCVGVNRELFGVPGFYEYHVLEAKAHFKREVWRK